jgi:curved DNA-binding protein CbpA
MKDYYYILGLKSSATTEEVQKAYRKLSLKFHPDKNDGDEFFTERFKEIQEAYEILKDNSKRKEYDNLKNSDSPDQQKNDGSNFNPFIEYFKSDKKVFEYNEEVTFSWKTINANKVILKPFGVVDSIGQKIYKIRDFKNAELTFELIAENQNIGRIVKNDLTLRNATYYELYNHFKKLLEKGNSNHNIKSDYEKSDNYTKQKSKVEGEQERTQIKDAKNMGERLNIIITCAFILFFMMLFLVLLTR